MTRGREIPRGAEPYETARRAAVWNARTPARFPAVIVTATSEKHVVDAIRAARDRNLKVSVLSGGHSWIGAQLRDDGMLVDLSALKELEIDASRRTAFVGPAVTGAELEAALHRRGLAFPVGHAPGVALGGYLLAGGLGWNSGAWGPACLSMSAIDVVLPTGELITADDNTDPELLWAARGSGPGFPGVVTRFHLRLRALPRAITTSTMVFALSDLSHVAGWAAEVTNTLPPNVELALRVGRLPDGAIGVRLSATAFAESREQADTALAPVHAYPGAGRPLRQDLMARTSLAALHAFVATLFPDRHRYAAEAIWSDRDLGGLLAMLGSQLEEAPSRLSFATGVIAPSVDDDDVQPDVAFSKPGRTFIVSYAIWDDERADRANLDWHAEVTRGLEAVAAGYYVGEVDVLDPRRARRCFTPAGWTRLRRLRDELDPDGLLHSFPSA